jgi:quinol monooxygenase YgiN
MTAAQLPETAVVRVSPGQFDPARFDEVQAMTVATGRYLMPAIKQLPGLISYHAGVSPDGSIVHVSIWESAEHAQQMSRLKEMIVDARGDAERAGVTFSQPIINYQIDWTI